MMMMMIYCNICVLCRYMPRHCCVTGCKSNYAGQRENVSTFSILAECRADEAKLRKWLRLIPRANLPLNENTVVCIRHFDEQFIVRSDSATRPDGTVLTVPRKIPKLSEDAYPSVFDNCPAYLSSKPPAKRKKPEERAAEQQERDNSSFNDWLDKDRIASPADLRDNFSRYVSQPTVWKCAPDESTVLFYILDVCDDVPHVKVSVSVAADLSVTVCCGGSKVEPSKLMWVLGDSSKIDCWSKFTCLLSHFQSYDPAGKSSRDKIESVLAILRGVCDSDADLFSDCGAECDESDADDSKCMRVIKYCAEQLDLLLQHKVKYSGDFLHWAFQVFSLSPSTYRFLRSSALMLPHPSYLRKMSTCFTVSPGSDCSAQTAYLTQKAQLLACHERDVSLLLDEIYVNPKVSYKGGALAGFAANCDLNQATTVQAFMICSVLSRNKDIAALVPIKNLTSDYLKQLTLQVLTAVENAGFRVLCIISDNNKVNGNMFRSLCGGELQSCIVHPCDDSRKLFFLFDTVHILKCVRNNWINQKDWEQTFVFPDFVNGECVQKARFRVLKDLYEHEKQSLAKLAPSLNPKALNPTSTERQSVPLMLRIFNDKVVTGLEYFADSCACPNDFVLDAKQFVQIFVGLWKMLNVKQPMKGRNLRDSFCDPIRTVDQLGYLEHVYQWLCQWEATDAPDRNGMLTKETSTALCHTVRTLTLLVEYLFEHLNYRYVLLGKFQTDALEYRFSQYRRLSGTNYHVSVSEIMESEKKLKLTSVLSLKSAQFGHVSISKFVSDHKTTEKKQSLSMPEDECECDLSDFAETLYDWDLVAVSDNEMHAIVFIAGYIGRKLKRCVDCATCVAEFVSNEKMTCENVPSQFAYLDSLDRGGLLWPSQTLVDIVTRVYCIFQCLVSAPHENKFVAVANQKNSSLRCACAV